VADVIGGHLRHQLLFGNVAPVDEVGEQRVDQRLLVGIRVALIALTLKPAQEIQRPALAQRVVDWQPGLPRLGPALGGVQDLGIRRQPVEIVPLGLQEADGRRVFALQFNPVDIIEPLGKEIVQQLIELGKTRQLVIGRIQLPLKL